MQSFQRALGGHLFSGATTATTAFGTQLQRIDFARNSELLGVRFAFGRG